MNPRNRIAKSLMTPPDDSSQIVIPEGHDPRLNWMNGVNQFALPQSELRQHTLAPPTLGDRMYDAVGGDRRLIKGAGDVAQHIFYDGPKAAAEGVDKAISNPSFRSISDAVGGVAMLAPQARLAQAAIVGKAGADVGYAAHKDGPSLLDVISTPAHAGSDDKFRDSYQRMNPFPQEVNREDYIRRKGEGAAKPFIDAGQRTKGTAERAKAEALAAQSYMGEANSVQTRRDRWQQDYDAAWGRQQDQDKQHATRPFRERFPDTTTALNSAALAVPAALGFRSGMRQSSAANREATALNKAHDAEAQAHASFSGGTASSSDLARAQSALLAQHGAFEAAKAPGYDKGTLLAGGAAAGVLAGAPEAIDLALPPTTRGGQNAREQMTSPSWWGQKAAFAALGAGGAEAGVKAGQIWGRAPTPNQSRALAIRDGGGLKSAEDLAANEASAASAGNAAQGLFASGRESRRHESDAAQRSAEASRLELEALHGIDSSKLTKPVQDALKQRLVQSLTPGQAQGQQRLSAPEKNLPIPPPITTNGGSVTTPPGQKQGTRSSSQDVADFLASPKKGADWASKYSDKARSFTEDALANGGRTLGNRTKSGGDPNGLVATDIAGATGAPVSTSERHLSLLRKEVGSRGIEPSAVSAPELRSILDKIDKRLFTAIGAAGVGASAAMQDQSRDRIARELMRGNQ